MQVKKKRLEKFKQHSKGILAPYCNDIIEKGSTDLNRLAKAINGIIYQYVGDEDRYLQRDEETLSNQTRCLEEAISQYHEMDDEEKSYLSTVSDGKLEENAIVNAHLTQIVFRTIHKQKPTYFFYAGNQNTPKEVESDFLDAKDLEDSQPPEDLTENPDVDTKE